MAQIEKIKAEIERLKKSLPWGSCASQLSMECNCKNEAYNEVLSYIDSLSDTEKDFSIKESVIPFGASDSELMEDTYFIPQGYHAVIEGNKVIIKKGEDSVSEDLEKAAWQYYDRNKPLMPSELDLHKELIDFFKAGVRWKEQNDSNLSEVLYRDNLDEMAEEYSSCTYLEEVLGEGDIEVLKARLKNTFKAGAQWRKEQMIEWLKENKDHPFIECEDPCLSGYLTDEFIEDFKKVMEE